MIAPYFPAILVPIIGIFLPGLAMAALFVYIEKLLCAWGAICDYYSLITSDSDLKNIFFDWDFPH